VHLTLLRLLATDALTEFAAQNTERPVEPERPQRLRGGRTERLSDRSTEADACLPRGSFVSLVA
jgi:hypothetical protein